MLKALPQFLLSTLALLPAGASAQLPSMEQQDRFNSIVGEANNHQERYDAIVEYEPRLAYDSKVTDPAEVSTAWKECKRVMASHRSFGHAQQLDAFFVAFPEGRFTDSEERAGIAIALAERNRDSNATLEPDLYKCLETFFSVKVKPFP